MVLSDVGAPLPAPVQDETRGDHDHGGCHEAAQVCPTAKYSEQAKDEGHDADHDSRNSKTLHGSALRSLEPVLDDLFARNPRP
jgi:hypothetical protein